MVFPWFSVIVSDVAPAKQLPVMLPMELSAVSSAMAAVREAKVSWMFRRRPGFTNSTNDGIINSYSDSGPLWFIYIYIYMFIDVYRC